MARHLPGQGQFILAVKSQHLVVQTVRRPKVRHEEGLAVELEAVAENMERTLEVEFP